jgi:uncharacterized protein YidB (DUF937 family)
MNRRWFLPGAILLIALLLGGGVAYSEAKTSDGSSARAKFQKLEQAFLSRLAKELGVSEARLRSAFESAGAATIDDAVRQKLITREQAAFLKGRLGTDELDFDLGFGRFKHGLKGGREKGFKRGRFSGLRELLANQQARTAVANAIARKLGMTREQLATALGEGKDLEELAEAKKLTEADLGAAIAAAAKPYVDRLVKAGTLERADADELLERLGRGAWLGKLLRGSLFAR